MASAEKSVAREEASPEERGEASDTGGGEASGADTGGTGQGSGGEADRTPEVGDAEDSQDRSTSGVTGDSDNAKDSEADDEERAEREEADDQGDEDSAGEADSDAEARDRDEPALPPVETVELSVLIDDCQRGDAGRRPWNWAGLPPGHREALVELIDGFVASYNRTWAMADDQLIPACWHRHPALAYDLAALVWAFHGAYRVRDASPEAALRFQGQLVPFADRLDRWLGQSAQECRDGHHPSNWRPVRTTSYRPERESLEYADEITLLGAEHFGFVASTRSAQV